MLNLIELAEKSFYEVLSDFFVNYLYENIINICFVEQKLIMMIYLLLEKLILKKLPDSIDEKNKKVSALYLKDTFLSYVFKDLTRKIDVRNFLYKILRNTILKIDEYKMVLSVDISVVNKFLKISKRLLKKNDTTKISGNISFNNQKSIVLDIYNFFEDNNICLPTVEDRLKKYENKEKNNINLAMKEYLNNLRNKMINIDINELDEDDLEQNINKEIIKKSIDIIDENENNIEDKDLFNNSLMIKELKRGETMQQSENFNLMIEQIKFNYNLITDFVNEIIKNIKDNLIFAPYSIKWISKSINILLKAKYNNQSTNQITPYQMYLFGLNFLIGNIILPVIREPDLIRVISNDTISVFTRDNLKIISNILNKMIKGTLFIKSKEPNMIMFNKYIIDTMPKLFELMDIIELQFDIPNIIKNLVNKYNLPDRNINYDYFKENPKENINYQSICFSSLITFYLSITINKNIDKFIKENINDEQKKIIKNFINNQSSYNLQFSREKMSNKYEFLYITKIVYSKEFNQRLEIMNSNNLIIKKPKEKNDLIFIIKKCLLEILKFAKKITKENSYDLSCNKGLDGIDFRKNLLSQIMNKIAFIINNNIENSNNKHIIFFTNYLYLNIDKLPNQYKEKNIVYCLTN